MLRSCRRAAGSGGSCRGDVQIGGHLARSTGAQPPLDQWSGMLPMFMEAGGTALADWNGVQMKGRPERMEVWYGHLKADTPMEIVSPYSSAGPRWPARPKRPDCYRVVAEASAARPSKLFKHATPGNSPARINCDACASGKLRGITTPYACNLSVTG